MASTAPLFRRTLVLSAGALLSFSSCAVHETPQPAPAQESTPGAPGSEERSFFETDLPFFETHKRLRQVLGVGRVPIQVYEFPNRAGSDAVFLTGGRGSSMPLYAHLVRSFYENGFTVYAFDHRGFGNSGRLTANPEVTYVDSFDDYVSDMKIVFDALEPRRRHKSVSVVTGSMGATVAVLYQRKYPSDFDSFVFAAPMFSINTGHYPDFVVRTLTGLMVAVGNGDGYAPKQGNFAVGDRFCETYLTHSLERCRIRDEMFQRFPQLRSGGASYQWVRESLRAIDNANASAASMTKPVLILQGSEDTRVGAAEQLKFCQAVSKCTLALLEGARHDVFNEVLDVRSRALSLTLGFLQVQAALLEARSRAGGSAP